ncbi:MAG: hypothetical protein JXA72_08980 [Bacteroidales bacterium]|nr:hypothetical protein [Bacteroidales bacterium]
MNITYMFGAGASYYSCPILNEQGDKMIQLSDVMGLDFKNSEITWQGYNQLNNIDRMLWDLYEYGRKANEFNTVDTYAKKLYLLGDRDSLKRLKRSVSLFFTLWLLSIPEYSVQSNPGYSVQSNPEYSVHF